MVKLQWLQINRFRSVKPGTRLTFTPGYNVLLGQNGTGKTTLLNLVAAVVQGSFWDLRESDFDLQYALSTDTGTATISVRNEHEHRTHPSVTDILRRRVKLHEPLGSDASFTEPVFSTQVKLESKTSGTAALETHGSSGTLQVLEGDTWGPPIKFESGINHTLWWKVSAALLATHLKHPSLLEMMDFFEERQLRRFDESLDYLTQLATAEIQLFYFKGEVHIQEGSLTPGELQDELTVLAQNQWGKDRYVIGHDRLPFLQQVVRLLDFESAEVILDLQESSEHEDSSWMKLSNPRFLFTHRGGWRISEKLLSYGQKRMLAFLYYLSTVSSVAVADELVNGLHHRWIQACMEALGQRQVFLTSQNPLLLDYLTFDTPEQVRSTFILSRWEGEGEQARMLWENMSQEAAEDFFDSYKVGFQQVGELLQAKGLW